MIAMKERRTLSEMAGASGISCPRCGCRELKVTNTEPMGNGRIRRRRACVNCLYKLVTFEVTIRDLGRQ